MITIIYTGAETGRLSKDHYDMQQLDEGGQTGNDIQPVECSDVYSDPIPDLLPLTAPELHIVLVLRECPCFSCNVSSHEQNH